MDRSDERSTKVSQASAEIDERNPSSIPSEALPEKVNGEEKEGVSDNESAAVGLQRLYRGYRARRTIADAATMAQKFGWWNVVEGAMLQYQSEQFYAYKTPQNAAQRWLRLKKKAARVGKGLSKNEKARKLALQHWLEAIDPRHRYGHNLHFYYIEWENCQTQEPFFYWLDAGGGRDVELEKCSRSKLQKDLIRYLSPKEREEFEVAIEDGKLIEKQTNIPVNTTNGEKWIFVMSTTGKLYVGKKEKGKLQHSSFLAGGATTAAGRLIVRDGNIELMEAHSGHYHPTQENFQELVRVLTSSGADLTTAQVRFFSDDMLTSSNSRKSMAVAEEMEDPGEPDTSIECDVVENEVSASGKEDDSAQVEMLTFGDEQDVSGVEHVHLMEGTFGPQDAQPVSEVEVEGHQIFEMGSDEGSPRKDMEMFKLEVIRPWETRESSQDKIRTQTEDDFEQAVKLASPRPKVQRQTSQHMLFAPALQTFNKLEERSIECTQSPDSCDMTSRSNADISPDTKVLLLRGLSLKNMVTVPS